MRRHSGRIGGTANFESRRRAHIEIIGHDEAVLREFDLPQDFPHGVETPPVVNPCGQEQPPRLQRDVAQVESFGPGRQGG